MRRLIGLMSAAAITVTLAVPARADDHLRVVVELFTSQGCSSCPPADELLERLAARDDVLPLALHVDYWDYIGWADTFADPGFTQRQKAYAHVAGSRTIFTPQMVVGGSDFLVGTREMELGELIERHREDRPLVRLMLLRRGDVLEIRAEAVGRLPGAVLVQLVRYRPQETVEIRRGENAGRSITYSNIVTDWRVVGRWDGQTPLALQVDAPGSQPAAVILQQEGPGAIVAAAVAE